MAFANNMALQVDGPNGIVRMVFVESRGPVEMFEVYEEDSRPTSYVVAEVVMPATMAREIAAMIIKAFDPPAGPAKAD